MLASHTTSQQFGGSGDGDRVGTLVHGEASVGREPREAVAPREFGVDVEAERVLSLPGGRERVAARELAGAPALSQPMLLLNVALSQGVFGCVLVVAVVLADVPWTAVGLGFGQVTGWLFLVGVALGVALYAVNEVGGSLADAAGLGRSEALRELMAPTSRRGWVVLLGGVLPIVAVFEELLFRGVLVGALSVGFGVSPWLLVVASSVLFGLGHGAQGRLGVLVTGALGVVLATAFVLSGSLLVVVVAHYLVNALEFVVHEGVLAGE
nr:type II CAAX endopeptidase family protein [Halorubellus salinus]